MLVLYLVVVVVAIVCPIETKPHVGPCAAHDLLERIDPNYYYTILHVEEQQMHWMGASHINITIIDSANRRDESKNVIALHAGDTLVKIFNATFDLNLPDSSHPINVTSLCHDKNQKLLVITLAEDLPDKSSGRVNVYFKGLIQKEGDQQTGLYKHTPTEVDNSIIKADYANTGARLVIPCFDDPKYEAIQKVTVVTSREMVATSSFLELNQRHLVGDKILNQFNETAPTQLGQISFEIRPKMRHDLW